MSESKKRSSPTALMIVDVSNFYYTIRKNFNPQARLDYEKFMNRFRDRVNIKRAIAYGAELEGAASGFKGALGHLGFETKYKEPKVFPSGNGKSVRKADWDVGMAMDIVRYAEGYDVLILGTADGDLAPCVQYIQELGIKVWIIGCGVSRDLKDVADNWEEFDLCDLLSNPTSGHAQRPR